MSKNPVFEAWRRRGATMQKKRGSIPIIGQQRRARRSVLVQPPFTYRAGTFDDDATMLETIFGHSALHPTTLLADSSLFSESTLDLCRSILIRTPITIFPEVHAELEDLRTHQSGRLRELVFPEGQLNSRLEVRDDRLAPGHARVASKYVNILHLRKRLIEWQHDKFTSEYGRAPVGEERASIVKELLQAGFGERTIRMGNKGDPRRRYTDEVLAMGAVLGPPLTGRDVVLLTADFDVFDQVEQLAHLIHDDYGSFLIALDYQAHPSRYPHRHAANTDVMKPGATAIGRPRDPEYLLPSVAPTCAFSVFHVRTREFLTWVCTRDVSRALAFQNSDPDGRVADAGMGMTAHMMAVDRDCRETFHFVVGEDEHYTGKQTAVGRICISRQDVVRIFGEKAIDRDRGHISMRGLPR